MLLPTAFDEENFNFFSKYMRGTKEQQPRWKRCVRAADGDLGEAVGIAYVQQTSGKEGKDRMLAMVKNLEKSLGDIQKLSWMTPASSSLPSLTRTWTMPSTTVPSERSSGTN